MHKTIDVGLVGATPNGADSLGLQYLATSLKMAGHRPRLIAFFDIGDLEEAVEKVIADHPPLLGVSILSGIAAIDALAFILRARQRGYTGHLTCGGPYATLCRQMLLERYPQIDSVVRHDGELPIRRLADAIAQKKPTCSLPGVSTRAGEGLPAPISDRACLDIRPERRRFKRYAGVLSAQISAVRGCWGSCHYCGLAALRKQALEEGIRCGFSLNELKAAGVGGMRRRAVVSVAEEIAELYHKQGVRFYHFIDENHLPKEASEARRVVDELTDELDKRGVKNRAINLMLRADIASDQVIDALGRLGLVRCLLGVESTNEQGLRALGRNSSPEVNLTAMKNLGKRGVMFHFNILLIHPESTIDSIDREIQGLSEVTGGLIDPFQVEVFQGTQLFNRLAREGRLLGGPLLYHYWPEEPMARRFAEIFLRLKRDAFGFLHLTAFAYEVLGAFAVARKLALIARQNAWLGRKAAELIDEHNVLWVDLLKRASVLSRASAGSAQVDQFIEQTQIRAALLTISFNDFKKTLEKTAIQPLTSDIFYPRTAAAVAVAVALLGPQGCAKETNVAHKTDTGIVSHDDASVDGGLIKDAGSGKDSNIAKGDSGRDANPTADKDSSAEASPYADAYICNETTARQEGNAMIDSVYNPCLKGLEPGLSCIGTSSSSDYWHGAITARFVLDEKGKVTDIQGNGSDRDFLTPELKACYLKALEGQTFPCLAEKNQYWIKCGVLLA